VIATIALKRVMLKTVPTRRFIEMKVRKHAVKLLQRTSTLEIISDANLSRRRRIDSHGRHPTDTLSCVLLSKSRAPCRSRSWLAQQGAEPICHISHE
jgi:hypothetical protein